VSVKVTTFVWESDIKPANVRMTLLALADNANDAGMCWPGVAHLCGKTGIARSTMFRILTQLEADGLLVRDERRRPNGSRRSNEYRIDCEALRSRARVVSAAEIAELTRPVDMTHTDAA
jgi:DNA-binding IclR family transcriptional regulator